MVLATGARPIELPSAPHDGTRIINSDDILRLENTPQHFLILGGGYIGCEFASIFSQLGSQVTLVEMEDRLLPGMDPDLADLLQRQFKLQRIGMHLGHRVSEDYYCINAAALVVLQPGDALPIGAVPGARVEELPPVLAAILARPATLA